MHIRSKSTLATINHGIATRSPFRAPSTLSAAPESAPFDTGRMSPADAATLRQHVQDNGGTAYVVRSYATPIAWHTTAHGWHVPDATYTATTARHIARIREAISDAN